MAGGPRRPLAHHLSHCPPLLPRGTGGGGGEAGGGGARDFVSVREIAEKASHMGRRRSLATAVGGGAGAGGGGGVQLPSGSHQPRTTEAFRPYRAPPPPY